MKLKVLIAESLQKDLENVVAEFNDWSYRLNDIALRNNLLEIDLGNLPVFWEQFMENVPPLKKKLKQAFIDAMREIPEEKIGISFNKAMAVLIREAEEII